MSEQTVSSPHTSTDPIVVVDEKSAKTALRIAKTKTFMKNTFVNVGRPAIAGAAGAALVLLYAIGSAQIEAEKNNDQPTDTETTE